MLCTHTHIYQKPYLLKISLLAVAHDFGLMIEGPFHAHHVEVEVEEEEERKI